MKKFKIVLIVLILHVISLPKAHAMTTLWDFTLSNQGEQIQDMDYIIENIGAPGIYTIMVGASGMVQNGQIGYLYGLNPVNGNVMWSRQFGDGVTLLKNVRSIAPIKDRNGDHIQDAYVIVADYSATQNFDRYIIDGSNGNTIDLDSGTYWSDVAGGDADRKPLVQYDLNNDGIIDIVDSIYSNVVRAAY